MPPAFDRIVVIGASAGGVAALLELTLALPPAFPAPICIVQHIGAHPSLLPQLLGHRRANPAVHPHDGCVLAAGTLYIAPPDRHMVLEGDRLRLTDQAKCNHARPAIDPLFMSAARDWGPRVIGVVLTGLLDDGSAGLRVIKEHGGLAIVQDPDTAVAPQMPQAALAAVAVDHCLPLRAIGPLLARLVHAPPAGAWLARAAAP